QIAEELMRAGRKVYLSISKHRRVPRRYRGHDHTWWWYETGIDKAPPEKLGPDRSPVVHSGAYGGHTIDFRDFASRGMTLLGRAEAATKDGMTFAADLADNLAHGDEAFLAYLDFSDGHISRKGADFPEDPAARRPTPTPPAMYRPIRKLEFRQAGVSSIIWATGYDLDFTWIDIPVFDARGAPIHDKGVTRFPGLYFIGLNFLSKFSSAFLNGVADDAERLANTIACNDSAARSAISS